MWLFLQQRCKIFVAIWLQQESKPRWGLMFLFVPITVNYRCFCVFLSDNNNYFSVVERYNKICFRHKIFLMPEIDFSFIVERVGSVRKSFNGDVFVGSQ